jgi:hypothetical protein
MATYKFVTGAKFEVCFVEPSSEVDNIGRVFEIVDSFISKADGASKYIVWRWVPDYREYNDKRDGGTSNENWFIEKLDSGHIMEYIPPKFDTRASRLEDIE